MNKYSTVLLISMCFVLCAVAQLRHMEITKLRAEINALKAHEPYVKWMKDQHGNIHLSIDGKHYRVLPKACGLRV